MNGLGQFSVRTVDCGGENLFLVAGPCVLEDASMVYAVADELTEVARRLEIGIIFKASFLKDNRSRSENFRGPGLDEGLALLDGVRERSGLPVLTDIHNASQAAAVGDVVDVVQIPAFLCMQTSLLEAAAATGKPVNLKHGQFLSPANMSLPISKFTAVGGKDVMLTERGYTFGYDDLIVDPRAFYELRQTGRPVLFDVTHSIRRYGVPSADPAGGRREYVDVLARAAVGAGIDGLFIEVHPEPERALCDAASQMRLTDLEEFLKPLLVLHAANRSALAKDRRSDGTPLKGERTEL